MRSTVAGGASAVRGAWLLGGQRNRYADGAQRLAEDTEHAEHLVALFNRVGVPRLADQRSEATITGIDVARLREAIQRIVAVAVHGAVEFARIKALDATGARTRAWVRLQQLLGPDPTAPS